MNYNVSVASLAICLTLTACGHSHHTVEAIEMTNIASEQARAVAPKLPAITFDDEHMPTMADIATPATTDSQAVATNEPVKADEATAQAQATN